MSIEAADLLGVPDRVLKVLAPDATHQHKKGGLYRFVSLDLNDADTGERMVNDQKLFLMLYEHVYPYRRQFWVRTVAEWTDGRFRKLEA